MAGCMKGGRKKRNKGMKAHGPALRRMLANPSRCISAVKYRHTLPIPLLIHVSTARKKGCPVTGSL
jgi:hypothetical protein